MKAEILKVLREADGHVSGQELCERLGVSRTAVWKIIGQLKEEGYQIEAVRNRGYLLKEAADVVTEAELLSQLGTAWAGRRLEYFEKTDSTNIRARVLAEAGAPHGTLAVADCQEAGKGRRGRNWSSPPGTGAFMSLVLRPSFKPQSASMVTLAAALAVSEGIWRAAGLRCQIKWPNDLVYGGRKLCGILTEMSTEGEDIRYVVVGIGINVNTEAFPPEVEKTATSLKLELGRSVKRSQVIGAVMGAFEEYYQVFERTADLSGLMEEYNRRSANLGKQVTVLDPAGEYRGEALGIDSQGSLLVRLPDGKVRQVISGEVSVRGIYGYV